jgi:F0F1-type ATP synthase assembly protein I
MTPGEQRRPDMMALLGIGVANVVALGVGLGLGWFIDDRAGTLPLFTMLGLAVGIVLAGLVTWSEIRKFVN